MGVPALFRWLSRKYPKIISPVIEEQPKEVDGTEVPVDTTQPNPNGFEYDNLYLDMNGIVHPCSHPLDRPPPETEEDMMLEVFKYTDRVVNMVRPRKLLMIAVDGVAPRAKMNQQRARRFRSAQEAKEQDADKAELLRLLKSQNPEQFEAGAEERMTKKTWDSNAITPGTPFMFKLAACLRYWCSYKINTDPGWANVKVIISDASVPGEGEHKIMEFIRSQRSSPHHDPNTRHVIYGLDADLIMLGLATHEPHFHVLREDVFFQESKARTCRICGQTGHKAEECRGAPKQKEGEFDEKEKGGVLKPFIWLNVSVLREYLNVELRVPNLNFDFDLERALDDWVFMCFFVGNDFLPHLPSLDIREDGIDTLIAIWRDNLPVMQGYVTRDGQVDLDRAQHILNGLAKQEDAIFRRRRQTEERREAGFKRRKLEDERRQQRQSDGGRKSPEHGSARRPGQSHEAPEGLALFAPSQGAPGKAYKQVTHDMVVNRGAVQKDPNQANKSAAAMLKSKLLNGGAKGSSTPASETEDTADTANSSDAKLESDDSPSSKLKRKADEVEGDDPSTPGRNTPTKTGDTPRNKPSDDEAPPDTVRLWEPGYADRYYEQKFHKGPDDIAFRNKVARAYVEGLAWVLLYYFQGCPSWTWFYPYHYAPFAADFVDIHETKIKFTKGTPFRPYEQLMGVLPAASNHAIPEVFRGLMSDEDSEILDFYPEDFPVDMNGKKMAWQGVVLLPFIDEKRLLDAMAKKYPLLPAEDALRNEFGKDVLIFSDQHRLYDEVVGVFYSKRKGFDRHELDQRISDGLAGQVEKNADYLPQSALTFPLDGDDMPSLDEDHSISVHYHIPHSTYVHKSMLIRGVKFDPPLLDNNDIENTRRNTRSSGRSFGGAPLRDGSSNGFDRGPGGRINYANQNYRPNQPPGMGGPGYAPQNFQNGGYNYPPPPGYSNQQGGGHYRPPPQQMNGYRGPPPGSGYRGPPMNGYGGGGGGYPGPPAQQWGNHQQYAPPNPQYGQYQQPYQSQSYGYGNQQPPRPPPQQQRQQYRPPY